MVNAKCEDCKQIMNESDSCNKSFIKIKNKWYKRNTTYFDKNKRCHDCSILNKEGNIHHGGCDMERCPKCDGQLISCGCIEKFMVR